MMSLILKNVKANCYVYNYMQARLMGQCNRKKNFFLPTVCQSDLASQTWQSNQASWKIRLKISLRNFNYLMPAQWYINFFLS